MIKFSVAMCVYGGDNPSFFREALDSIYSQTLLPDEIVLVVDGPVPEEINNVIKAFEESTIDFKCTRLEKNNGHGIARRVAMEKCSFDYVAIVDSDDINCSNRFAREIAEFESDKSLSAVGSFCYHFTDNTSNVIVKETVPLSNDEIRDYIKRRCPICQPTVMLKKDDVLAVGGYQDWYWAEDYYLWIRMVLGNKRLANINEYLVYHRTSLEQMNRRGGWKYFSSLRKLYKYMLKNKMINYFDYFFNVSSRFIMQIMFTSRMRQLIRRLFL